MRELWGKKTLNTSRELSAPAAAAGKAAVRLVEDDEDAAAVGPGIAVGSLGIAVGSIGTAVGCRSTGSAHTPDGGASIFGQISSVAAVRSPAFWHRHSS